MDDTFGFVEAVSSNATRFRFRQGVVTAVASDYASLSATIAGDSTVITGIKFLKSYFPIVGDAVWLLTDGQDLMAIGTLAAVPSGGTISSHVPYAFAAGQSSATFSASANGVISITFPVGRFTQPPAITGNVITTSAASIGSIIRFASVTSTGCGGTLSVGTAFTGSVPFNWIAIQMTEVGYGTTPTQ